MHNIFLEWILSQKTYWGNKEIVTEEIIDKIDPPAYPGFPFVSVHHTTEYAMGQISLHSIHQGYILDFETLKINSNEKLFYHYEFSENPVFNLWQEKYIEFLCSE